MAGELRLGCGEPVEEELDRGGASRAQPVREPHAARTEPVARDLVDDDGVEIVHRRVAVAVEGDRSDRRQRGRDLLQRVLHARVERRAPEGGPVAAAAVEAGVDEALRDGALGQLHDGEERPRGAARLQARRRSGRERDERARIEPAGGESVPDRRQLGDRGHAEVELAGGERAVGVPDEDEGGGVLLPHELERGGRRNLGGSGCQVRRHDLSP